MQTEVVVLITAIIGLVSTLCIGFIMVWKEIRGVHRVINSRMDELLVMTRKLSYAAGLKEGREEERK